MKRQKKPFSAKASAGREKEKNEYKPDEKKENLELDFGFGKLGLGGLFEGIKEIVELAERAEKAGGVLRREGEIYGKGPEGRKDVRGVYGFTVRTGLSGRKPHIETFGNIKKTPQGPTVAETREPIVDVFDEEHSILIIAELPGIHEQDIGIELHGKTLTIQASDQERKYRKEIELPGEVDIERKMISCNNGILKLILPKKREPKTQ